jgi:hypothetical protein
MICTGKKVLWGLIVTLQGMNFYDTCAGFAGIILILPAGITRPAPAENTLAEFRYLMRCGAEIAQVLGETLGVLYRGFPLLSHHRNLSFQLAEEIG